MLLLEYIKFVFTMSLSTKYGAEFFSGLLLDGAFRLRVANGDIDVFIPGPIRLSSKDFDKEDQVWSQRPCSTGDDHHNPYEPQPGKDCISRLSYV